MTEAHRTANFASVMSISLLNEKHEPGNYLESTQRVAYKTKQRGFESYR